MAHIKNIFVCPKCDEGITAEGSIDKCPSCGHILGSMGQFYKEPLTYAEQHQKYQDTNRFRDAIIALPAQKAEYILLDALRVIETLAGKKVVPQDIRKIVETAMSIGDIAKSYDAYLRAGGKHVPSLFIDDNKNKNKNNNNMEQQDEHSKTTRGSEPVTAGTSEPTSPFFLPDS